MPTSCNTHDYDGKLCEKWFKMRPILIEKYLPNCLSFDDTIKEIEQWLDKKYFNVKRIGRARRSIRILTSQRRSNFDSRNDIDVEELLPILWDKVKNQEDIHDTFYEQLCDITGGSCAQGRSTRLFQFLFLFDLPLETSEMEEEKDKTEISNEEESIKKDLSQTVLDNNSLSISKEESKTHQEQSSEEEQQLQKDQQSQVDEKPEGEQQLQKDQQSHLEENTEGEQQLQKEQESDDVEPINSSSN